MKLVIVRHGQDDYMNGGGLSKQGAVQSKNIAQLIKDSFTDKRLKVFTSPIKRAIETAAIIAEVCSLEQPQQLDWLSCDEQMLRGDLSMFYDANDDLFDVVVLVSHMSRCKDICLLYGRSIPFDNNCTAVLIDGKTRTVEKIN